MLPCLHARSLWIQFTVRQWLWRVSHFTRSAYNSKVGQRGRFILELLLQRIFKLEDIVLCHCQPSLVTQEIRFSVKTSHLIKFTFCHPLPTPANPPGQTWITFGPGDWAVLSPVGDIFPHFSPFISYYLVIWVYIILLKQILSSIFTGNIFFFLRRWCRIPGKGRCYFL